MKRILVTGAAGFIGGSLVDRLLDQGYLVTAIDNFDPFYDPSVKRACVTRHSCRRNYTFCFGDIRDTAFLARCAGDYDVIVHLAAKAGVRPSIMDPGTYYDVNVRGTLNVLEFAKAQGIKQFVFASSSSVYGINPKVPWCEEDAVPLPISPYASTKLSGELLGHVYSTLYGIRFLALRFFTVYGPGQRPDLAIHKFTRQILLDQPVTVFGDGSSRRDYTYVADIVEGIHSAMHYTDTLFEVINLGNNRTLSLLETLREIEDILAKRAQIVWMAEQAGDVPETWADLKKARQLLNYQPQTAFHDGVVSFKNWLLRTGVEQQSSFGAAEGQQVAVGSYL